MLEATVEFALACEECGRETRLEALASKDHSQRR